MMNYWLQKTVWFVEQEGRADQISGGPFLSTAVQRTRMAGVWGAGVRFPAYPILHFYVMR